MCCFILFRSGCEVIFTQTMAWLVATKHLRLWGFQPYDGCSKGPGFPWCFTSIARNGSECGFNRCIHIIYTFVDTIEYIYIYYIYIYLCFHACTQSPPDARWRLAVVLIWRCENSSLLGSFLPFTQPKTDMMWTMSYRKIKTCRWRTYQFLVNLANFNTLVKQRNAQKKHCKNM